MKTYTIEFYFYGSKQVVPFDYMDKLLSFLHTEILGKDNKYHNDTSLYSINSLINCNKNAITQENGIIFDKGALWLIRTPSVDIFKDFYLKGKNAETKELGYGLVLKKVEFSVKEFKNETELIIGTSPVYLGQNENSKKRDHLTYLHGEEITTMHLKRTLITKANKFGYHLNEKDFNIEFVLNNPINPIKTKRVLIDGSSNITTQGKIKITGNSDVICLCYGFGVGLSTGCGFGFLYNIN